MATHYTKAHEWARMEGETAIVGISEHAQEQLGDVVFVELPEVGRTVAKGDEIATVESVKAASDIYAPLSGEVIETNSELENNPAVVNEDAEGAAWFLKIKPSDAGELEGLMDEEAYRQYLESIS